MGVGNEYKVAVFSEHGAMNYITHRVSLIFLILTLK